MISTRYHVGNNHALEIAREPNSRNPLPQTTGQLLVKVLIGKTMNDQIYQFERALERLSINENVNYNS